MKVYIDTGLFIDYLIFRGPVGSYLRTAARRGRSPVDLCTDAERCLSKIAQSHKGITSSLTYYEVEEALFRELARKTTGVAHARKYLIPAARSAMTQVMMTVELFSVDVIDLTHETIREQVKNVGLQMQGIRAADSLHITTAILYGADMIISTDEGVLALDSTLTSVHGAAVRCVDSDEALRFL